MPHGSFTFVDLFAGIGGFTAALTALGGRCVYAVEIDRRAAAVYERNWGHSPLGDITLDATDTVMKVPPHDVLAAGFPCQPFSKSGAQLGMEETRGTLYWHILAIIKAHHPSVVLLENVRNLAGPRHLHEWQVILETLRMEGYRVSETPAVFSPHQLPPSHGGRPQVRERVFITATYDPDGVGGPFEPEPVVTPRTRVNGFDPATEWSLDDYLDPDHHVTGCDLTAAETHWIDAWDEFVRLMWEEREGRRLPGFPLWADHWVDVQDLEIEPGTPAWKETFLRWNAEFYTAHKKTLNLWAARWGVYTEKFPPSRRKLEWQAQDTPRLWDTVMHFRPSGIRAKRPTYLPALVAITQTSIIGPRGRRLSPREAARLQGLPDSFDFGAQPAADIYRQLGSATNVGAAWHVLKAHISRDNSILLRSQHGRNLVEAIDQSPLSPDRTLEDLLGKRGTGFYAALRRPLAARLPEEAESPHFLEAASRAEAVARLYALAGTHPRPLAADGTTPRSAFTDLAGRFRVPLADEVTRARLAARIVQFLGSDWPPIGASGDDVSLHGLNLLLRVATARNRSATPAPSEAAFAAALFGEGFAPARSKLEAVNRISAITHSGGQDLGPGSKERKSVLVDLASGLHLDIDPRLPKPHLGAAIAERLGVPWTERCWSSGQTITLYGLNYLLAGAERRAGLSGRPVASAFQRPADEAGAILSVIAASIPADWDGVECVTQMRAAEFRHWRQTEWAGWYLEYRGIPALVDTFGGEPHRVLAMTFDYALHSVWDLKTHSDGRAGTAILNDLAAIEACLDEGRGLGFVVLSGDPSYEGAEDFDRWHRTLRGAGPATDGSRRLKTRFRPTRLDAFHLADRAALIEATASGALSVMRPGRQPDGSPRKDKYVLNLDLARQQAWMHVGERQLTAQS